MERGRPLARLVVNLAFRPLAVCLRVGNDKLVVLKSQLLLPMLKLDKF